MSRVLPGKIGQRFETGGEALDVGGRPAAHRAEQRRAARLGDHRLGVALAQRQHAQREVARDLDRGAAHAEGQREAEIGIARDAGEHLDAAGDELLHQERDIGRPRIEPVDALAQLRESARKLLASFFEADGDEAELGLVRRCRPTAP